ncbi:hypothetical protein FHS00_002924 [Limimaricola variabilis]|uniref:Uncharacterized protein n=1 Tax=Limimaricola variabilis TaxID=1492771 RepID=A0ABR6HS78_9RHOB|nr:hypothetical protein [Limimaricola variabilis]MBB3713322.1 hypothetical protein [Limimaricola variabilis]
MKTEVRLAKALGRAFHSLPVIGCFESGANQQADHVTVTDERGGIWELALFSRASLSDRRVLLRELAAAAGECSLESVDRLGYREVSAFKVTDWVGPGCSGQPAKLRLQATKRVQRA